MEQFDKSVTTPLADPQPSPENPGEVQPQIDEHKLTQYISKLQLEQNLPMGFTFGVGAMLLSAIIWAAVTATTGYQIGYMAIGLGFAVGYAVRMGGKGLDKHFGFMGAALALFGCLLGNYLSFIAIIAGSESLGYLETLDLIPLSAIPDIMGAGFSPIDLLFYGLAVYEGYKFSFRQISEEELRLHTTVNS
jgi:hypothetical protein